MKQAQLTSILEGFAKQAEAELRAATGSQVPLAKEQSDVVNGLVAENNRLLVEHFITADTELSVVHIFEIFHYLISRQYHILEAEKEKSSLIALCPPLIQQLITELCKDPLMKDCFAIYEQLAVRNDHFLDSPSHKYHLAYLKQMNCFTREWVALIFECGSYVDDIGKIAACCVELAQKYGCPVKSLHAIVSACTRKEDFDTASKRVELLLTIAKQLGKDTVNAILNNLISKNNQMRTQLLRAIDLLVAAKLTGTAIIDRLLSAEQPLVLAYQLKLSQQLPQTIPAQQQLAKITALPALEKLGRGVEHLQRQGKSIPDNLDAVNQDMSKAAMQHHLKSLGLKLAPSKLKIIPEHYFWQLADHHALTQTILKEIAEDEDGWVPDEAQLARICDALIALKTQPPKLYTKKNQKRLINCVAPEQEGSWVFIFENLKLLSRYDHKPHDVLQALFDLCTSSVLWNNHPLQELVSTLERHHLLTAEILHALLTVGEANPLFGCSEEMFELVKVLCALQEQGRLTPVVQEYYLASRSPWKLYQTIETNHIEDKSLLAKLKTAENPAQYHKVLGSQATGLSAAEQRALLRCSNPDLALSIISRLQQLHRADLVIPKVQLITLNPYSLELLDSLITEMNQWDLLNSATLQVVVDNATFIYYELKDVTTHRKEKLQLLLKYNGDKAMLNQFFKLIADESAGLSSERLIQIFEMTSLLPVSTIQVLKANSELANKFWRICFIHQADQEFFVYLPQVIRQLHPLLVAPFITSLGIEHTTPALCKLLASSPGFERLLNSRPAMLNAVMAVIKTKILEHRAVLPHDAALDDLVTFFLERPDFGQYKDDPAPLRTKEIIGLVCQYNRGEIVNYQSSQVIYAFSFYHQCLQVYGTKGVCPFDTFKALATHPDLYTLNSIFKTLNGYLSNSTKEEQRSMDAQLITQQLVSYQGDLRELKQAIDVLESTSQLNAMKMKLLLQSPAPLSLAFGINILLEKPKKQLWPKHMAVLTNHAYPHLIARFLCLMTEHAPEIPELLLTSIQQIKHPHELHKLLAHDFMQLPREQLHAAFRTADLFACKQVDNVMSAFLINQQQSLQRSIQKEEDAGHITSYPQYQKIKTALVSSLKNEYQTVVTHVLELAEKELNCKQDSKIAQAAAISKVTAYLSEVAQKQNQPVHQAAQLSEVSVSLKRKAESKEEILSSSAKQSRTDAGRTSPKPLQAATQASDASPAATSAGRKRKAEQQDGEVAASAAGPRPSSPSRVSQSLFADKPEQLSHERVKKQKTQESTVEFRN